MQLKRKNLVEGLTRGRNTINLGLQRQARAGNKRGPYDVELRILTSFDMNEHDSETISIRGSGNNSTFTKIEIEPELNEPVTVEFNSPVKILANQEYFTSLHWVNQFRINFKNYQL